MDSNHTPTSNGHLEPSPPSPSTLLAQPYTAPDLSYLSSPVPDFASTLHTQAADEADEANVSFLRESLELLDREPRSQSHIDSRRDPRLHSQPDTANSQPGAGHSQNESLDDLSRRERLQRVLARLNRIHDPARSSASAYSNRTPSPNRQRLYDWAPSQHASDDTELDQILAELRRQQPESQPDAATVQRASSRQGEPSSTTELTDATERRDRLRERRRRDNEWVSLRSRAVLQRARQEGSGSPSATERMLRYVMERERSGISEEEQRARESGWFSPSASRTSGEQQHRGGVSSREPWPVPPSLGDVRTHTRQERAEVQRRHLAENVPPRLPRISTPPVPTASPLSGSSSQFLENALKYLNQLRSCYRYEDSLSAAIDNRLATKEFFADKHDDFIMDLDELAPLADSSWLQPGTIYEGHQHATSSTAVSLLQTRPGNFSHSVEQINPNFRNQGAGFDHPPGSTRVQPPFDATRPLLSHQYTTPILNSLSPLASKPSDSSSHDHWPVRVIIHSIDAERMTLQGTMEAYDVPQHSSNITSLGTNDRPKAGNKNAPITTYLEGHIIDLRTHSFLTPSAADVKRSGAHPTSTQNSTPYTTVSDTISFPSANAHTDASNWRKLPPFDALPSDDESARCLLSQARMNEIHQEYIFMRWKERCFVHSKDDKCSEADRGGDQDRGHGLTISGFYYVSLRRGDGCVSGLYFDPTSTPYQHLRLTGHRTGWPAFEFR